MAGPGTDRWLPASAQGAERQSLESTERAARVLTTWAQPTPRCTGWRGQRALGVRFIQSAAPPVSAPFGGLSAMRCRNAIWLLFAALPQVSCGSFGIGMCGNEELMRLKSPDGLLDAVMFERDCGATTSVSTQVSIVQAGRQLRNEGGNLFVSSGPVVSIGWQAPRTLLISQNPGPQVFKAPSFIDVPMGSFDTTRVNLVFKQVPR